MEQQRGGCSGGPARRRRREARRPRVDAGGGRRVREWREVEPQTHYLVLGLGGAMPAGRATFNAMRWPARLGREGFAACLYVLSLSYQPGGFVDVDIDGLTDCLGYTGDRQTRNVIDELVALGAIRVGEHRWHLAVDIEAIERLPRREREPREASMRAPSQDRGCAGRSLPASEADCTQEPEPEPAGLHVPSFGLGAAAAFNLLKTGLCETDCTQVETDYTHVVTDCTQPEIEYTPPALTDSNQTGVSPIQTVDVKEQAESTPLAFSAEVDTLNGWVRRQPWAAIDSTRRRMLSDEEARPVIERLRSNGLPVPVFVQWLHEQKTMSADRTNPVGLLNWLVDEFAAGMRPIRPSNRAGDRSGGPPGKRR